MTETIAIKLKTVYTSLQNKLYDQFGCQLSNTLYTEIWSEIRGARTETPLNELQTMIQTQFNTLLYTEEELKEDESNRARILENALSESDIKNFTTITDYLKSISMTHVEKYNN